MGDSTGYRPDFKCIGESSVIEGSIAAVLSVVGILSNTLVLIITCKLWKKYTLCKKLIGALALFDLLFSIVQLATSVPLLWTCQWIYGNICCKLFSSILLSSATLSIGFILVIGIERYVGIVHPLTRGMSAHGALVSCCTCSLVACGLAVPNYLNITVSEEHQEHYPLQCIYNWSNLKHEIVYSWTVFFVGFLLPIIILTILYICIIRVTRSSLSQIRSMASSDIQAERRIKENKRIMIILISLLVAFVVLVLPNNVYWLLKNHGHLENAGENTNKYFLFFAHCCFSLQVTINPIIYSVVDSKFRTNLKKLFWTDDRSTVFSTDNKTTES